LDQGDAHLLLTGLGLGLDGDADDGVGELHGLEDDRVLLIAQGVAGGGVLQAHGGGDIAGVDLVDILPVVGVHLQDAADALLAFRAGVEHGGAGGQVPE
jgi:hypothetical protein